MKSSPAQIPRFFRAEPIALPAKPGWVAATASVPPSVLVPRAIPWGDTAKAQHSKELTPVIKSAGMNGLKLLIQKSQGEKLRPLAEVPEVSKRILRLIDSAIATVKKATHELNKRWNPETLHQMRALFASTVKSSEVRSIIQKHLFQTLDVLRELRANEGKDIYVGELRGEQTVAASYRKKQSGYTGKMGFSEANLKKIDDNDLQKTIIHEASHIGAKLDDHWYVKVDSHNEFFRKAPVRTAGELPPLNIEQALYNADTLARAAMVLAKNNRHRDEL